MTPGASLGDGFTIAGAALRLQGLPYRLGGIGSPRLRLQRLRAVRVQPVRHGASAHRPDQYHAGRKVSLDDVVPGDLVFFVTHGDEVSHVGIVIGGDRFVHAPNSRGVVRIDSLAYELLGRTRGRCPAISGG